MQFLRRVWSRLRSTPPRVVAFSLAGVVIVALITAGGFWAWDYTNSPPFCGTTCHTMPPHYQSYLSSSHARVKCVECHIGRTSFGIEITRKAVDAQFVWAYLTGSYKYPIYVKNLQPARETCEKCHWPEKFSNDKVVNITHYGGDDKNSAETTTLVMKTGGGTARQGLGFGIHWHIENQIDYIATDDLQQNIPWVQVTDAQGTKTVYRDIQKPLTDDQITKADKRRMDCIDCHNRASHNFESPETALDAALGTRQIDPTIPGIRQKGVELLTPDNKVAGFKTPQEAVQTIANLEKYYQETQPAFYSQNTAAVQNAVKALQQIYTTIHYPDQGLDWTTHPDNLGHKDWAGCFRCHDGKHFTANNQKAIRLECNVCHSIPEVNKAGAPAPALSLARTDEPTSHKTTTWLAEHRNVFDASCQQCHDTRNAGGKDNSSFCSNSACHGTDWKFAGLNAPELISLVKPPAGPKSQPGAPPPKIPHPIGGNPDCQICHGPKSVVRPYPADHQGRANATCTACHQPSIPPEQAKPLGGGPPTIPHDLAGRAECLGCHGSGAASVPQVPQFHKDYEFPNSGCLNCHKPGSAAAPAAPAATPTPTATPSLGASETAAPSETATATPSAAAPTATTAAPSAGGPPAQPADHAGRTVCLACHGTGVAGAPTPPADHAGRADETCAACHKPQ